MIQNPETTYIKFNTLAMYPFPLLDGICNGEESSCKTVTCLQGQACYTYQSQPSKVTTQQSSDPTIVQQPLNGDSHYLQPLEDDSNSQPVDGEAGTTLAD
jgi:hypothetical protein